MPIRKFVGGQVRYSSDNSTDLRWAAERTAFITVARNDSSSRAIRAAAVVPPGADVTMFLSTALLVLRLYSQAAHCPTPFGGSAGWPWAGASLDVRRRLFEDSMKRKT